MYLHLASQEQSPVPGPFHGDFFRALRGTTRTSRRSARSRPASFLGWRSLKASPRSTASALPSPRRRQSAPRRASWGRRRTASRASTSKEASTRATCRRRRRRRSSAAGPRRRGTSSRSSSSERGAALTIFMNNISVHFSSHPHSPTTSILIVRNHKTQTYSSPNNSGPSRAASPHRRRPQSSRRCARTTSATPAARSLSKARAAWFR